MSTHISTRYRASALIGAIAVGLGATFCSAPATVAGEAALASPARASHSDSSPAQATANARQPIAGTLVDSRGDQWRYRRYNNQWWYWMPGNYWMIWVDGNWIAYDPNTYSNYYPNYSYDNYYYPNYGYSNYYYPNYGYYGGYAYPYARFGFSWGNRRGDGFRNRGWREGRLGAGGIGRGQRGRR